MSQSTNALSLRTRVYTMESTASLPRDAPTAQTFYLPELDCLRFLAFLGVFAFHARHSLEGIAPISWLLGMSITNAAYAGSFGVDLFFVLSAFLITELLLREKETTGSLNVPAFYVRRILRIWPLYFFFLGIVAVLHLFDPSQQFGWRYLISFGLLSGNWAIVLFGVPASVANILWSVCMEEQFYRIFLPFSSGVSVLTHA
jgi:peptidoglycan/LPS O-acetylase OafA/YrhL